MSDRIKPNDLVVALEDRRRGIFCVGIVAETKMGQDMRSYARVLWGSSNRPEYTPTFGWWLFDELVVQ